jgi:hypothetical protein
MTRDNDAQNIDCLHSLMHVVKHVDCFRGYCHACHFYARIEFAARCFGSIYHLAGASAKSHSHALPGGNYPRHLQKVTTICSRGFGRALPHLQRATGIAVPLSDTKLRAIANSRPNARQVRWCVRREGLARKYGDEFRMALEQPTIRRAKKRPALSRRGEVEKGPVTTGMEGVVRRGRKMGENLLILEIERRAPRPTIEIHKSDEPPRQR